jgi:uncharacterized membrane protein YeaQ/YmgE (transglycosylase-associated protein family)
MMSNSLNDIRASRLPRDGRSRLHNDRMTGGGILATLLTGFVIGGAARFAVPGPDPMPFWLTVLIGLGGSVIGTVIAVAVFGSGAVVSTRGHAFVSVMLEILAGAGLVVLYRRFVQRRPLAGPEAYRFPTRGVGIARMRARLRRLGVDPDRLPAPGGEAAPPGPSAEEAAAELERLREQRERGEISEKEYDEARERLRRF